MSSNEVLFTVHLLSELVELLDLVSRVGKTPEQELVTKAISAYLGEMSKVFLIDPDLLVIADSALNEQEINRLLELSAKIRDR